MKKKKGKLYKIAETRGPFLERPDNLSGKRASFKIKTC